LRCHRPSIRRHYIEQLAQRSGDGAVVVTRSRVEQSARHESLDLRFTHVEPDASQSLVATLPGPTHAFGAAADLRSARWSLYGCRLLRWSRVTRAERQCRNRLFGPRSTNQVAS
jgi:hypothetical protein